MMELNEIDAAGTELNGEAELGLLKAMDNVAKVGDLFIVAATDHPESIKQGRAIKLRNESRVIAAQIAEAYTDYIKWHELCSKMIKEGFLATGGEMPKERGYAEFGGGPVTRGSGGR